MIKQNLLILIKILNQGILGYCNESDTKKSLNLVKGMKIKSAPNYTFNCDIYNQGKMSNDRNKTLDRKAHSLNLVN